MSATTREKLKTVMLGFLIVSSMVLTGIHWRQQTASQWLPFRFLSALFQSDAQQTPDIETVKWHYLQPKTIMIHESQDAQWVIPTNDALYEKIWTDTRVNYLPELMRAKPNRTFALAEWDSLILPGSTVVSFHTSIPWSLLSWYVGVNPQDTLAQDLVMLAFVPAEDINASVQTVFVKTNQGVNKYLVNIQGDYLAKRFYMDLPNSVKFDTAAILLTKISALGDFPANPDILINFLSKSVVDYPIISSEVPEQFQVSIENIDAIQSQLLLNLQDSLVPRIDKNSGDAVFSDVDNQYRFSTTGDFRYQNLRQPQKSTGSIAEAFEQAMVFMESRKGLWQNAQLVLTGIAFQDGRYTFSFHYKIKDMLVYLQAKPLDKLQSPVSITADASGVQACSWQVISLAEQSRNRFSLFFIELMNELLPVQYPDAFPSKEDNRVMESLQFGYVLNITEREATLSPSWLIGITGKQYIIPLKVE